MKIIVALAILLSLASCVNYAQPTFGDDDGHQIGTRYHPKNRD